MQLRPAGGKKRGRVLSAASSFSASLPMTSPPRSPAPITRSQNSALRTTRSAFPSSAKSPSPALRRTRFTVSSSRNAPTANSMTMLCAKISPATSRARTFPAPTIRPSSSGTSRNFWSAATAEFSHASPPTLLPKTPASSPQSSKPSPASAACILASSTQESRFARIPFRKIKGT